MQNKKSKPKLSSKILEWKKGDDSSRLKFDTYNKVVRAINKDEKLKESWDKGLIYLGREGSFSKQDAVKGSEDIDLNLIYFKSKEVQFTQRDYEKELMLALKQEFKDAIIIKSKKAIQVHKGKNNCELDIVVLLGGNGENTLTYIDAEGKELKYTPKEDRKQIAKLNELTQSKYSNMVRIFKSINKEIKIDNNKNIKSYEIETLLSNINIKILSQKYDDKIEKDYLKRFKAALSAMIGILEQDKFKIKKLNGKDCNWPTNKKLEMKYIIEEQRKYIKNQYNMNE